MNRYAPSVLLAAAAVALVWPHVLAGQRGNHDYGVLLSPQVPCREAPSSEAGVASVLRLTGNAYRERVAVRDSAVDAAGVTWVSVRQSPPLREEWCWVPETHVGPTRDPNTLLVMADRLLSAPDGRPVTDWVAVHNYFQHYRREVEASAVLSLRRLEVLMRALNAAQTELRREDPDPRVVAWLESLGADVEVSPDRFGRHRWAVSRSALDALLEAHRDDPVAEEILWKTARYSTQPDECARSLSCVFEGPVSDVAGYWLSYPDGRFVGDAVWTALSWLRRVAGMGLSVGSGGGILETCEDARDAEPDVLYGLLRRRWDDLEWEAMGKPAARSLLETLNEVGDAEKAPLVDYLSQVERCAREVAARPAPEEPLRNRGAAGTAQETEPSPEPRELAIIAPGVLCRAEPSRMTHGYWLLPLDKHFTTGRPDTVVAGETWVSWGGCWVPRAETAPADAHDHVLAIADRFLTSGEGTNAGPFSPRLQRPRQPRPWASCCRGCVRPPVATTATGAGRGAEDIRARHSQRAHARLGRTARGRRLVLRARRELVCAGRGLPAGVRRARRQRRGRGDSVGTCDRTVAARLRRRVCLHGAGGRSGEVRPLLERLPPGPSCRRSDRHGGGTYGWIPAELQCGARRRAGLAGGTVVGIRAVGPERCRVGCGTAPDAGGRLAAGRRSP